MVFEFSMGYFFPGSISQTVFDPFFTTNFIGGEWNRQKSWDIFVSFGKES